MLKTLPAVGALIIAAVLVVPTVSQAASSNMVRVSYADLNLASARGIAALHGRIAVAARDVCEIENSRDPALASATRACRSGAITDAQPAIDAAVAAGHRVSVTVLAGAVLVAAPQ